MDEARLFYISFYLKPEETLVRTTKGLDANIFLADISVRSIYDYTLFNYNSHVSKAF